VYKPPPKTTAAKRLPDESEAIEYHFPGDALAWYHILGEVAKYRVGIVVGWLLGCEEGVGGSEVGAGVGGATYTL
jgi:hypothetical protein